MTTYGFLTENRHSKCIGLYFNEKAKLSFQFVLNRSAKLFSSVKEKNTKPFSDYMNYIWIREDLGACWYVISDMDLNPNCAFVGSSVNDNKFSDLI